MDDTYIPPLDEVRTMSYLKEKYKDDPSYKDNPEFKTIGLNPEELILSYKELMAHPIGEREQVLSPIVCKGGMTLLHAAAGVGKSHFSLNVAYAVAQGGRFLKYTAPKPLKVLYVDGELGWEDIQRYMCPIEKVQGKLDFPENLSFFCCDKFPQSNMPKLDNDPGRRFYVDYILKNGINGVFFDNLKMLSNIDENNPREWNPIQSMFLELRGNGVFTWLVHHAGNEAGRQRGTSARMDAMNTVISLQKVSEEDNKINVVYQKSRHFFGEDAKPFEITNNFDGTWTYQTLEITFDQKVLELKKRGDNVTQIAADLKCYRNRVYRAIDRLKIAGHLF